jgi:hypothetical protein
MKNIFRHLGIFLLAVLIGSSYAVLIGMINGQLRAPVIAWPIFIIMFWLLFGKFHFLRYVGFILIPPVLVIGFQFYWSTQHPGVVADDYLAMDRSHYTPNKRVKNLQTNMTDPNAAGWQVHEILLGADGFRADPATGRGNPERCQYVLIGDSMIYGTGLAYGDSLGPVLARMGIQPCIFGVTGNSPADYLATLKYVADRIDPGAFIVFYIYAYNDFVDLSYYMTRRVRGYTGWFPRLYKWVDLYDQWRRTTIIFAMLHGPRKRPPLKEWQFEFDGGKHIKFLYDHDPKNYEKPRPLTVSESEALKLFFRGVADTARNHSWRIAMVIHPDNAEIYANLARHARVFVDLDTRRAQAREICMKNGFLCEDISHLIYAKTIKQGINPFFNNDRHFSRIGTRIVAEHFAELAARDPQSSGK